MSRIIKQWLVIVAGLFVFAFGVHLTIFANIGLAPWDCLGMGIARHTPLNYGLSMTAMSVVILMIDLALKERIGFDVCIVDINDIDGVILGVSEEGMDRELYARILKDNPLGQSGQQTPMGIIRKA